MSTLISHPGCRIGTQEAEQGYGWHLGSPEEIQIDSGAFGEVLGVEELKAIGR